MVIENCDEFGFPAEPTPVHPTKVSRPMRHRTPQWRESTNAKRRRRYRMARAAGYSTQDAMAMSQGKDWF